MRNAFSAFNNSYFKTAKALGLTVPPGLSALVALAIPAGTRDPTPPTGRSRRPAVSGHHVAVCGRAQT
jgi:hypothetical protein